MPSIAQTRAIHALRRKAGLTEDDYRAMLAGAGAQSSKDLSGEGANALIRRLKDLAGQGTAAANAAHRSRLTTATGRFAKILQALWIAGYNLGVVRNRDDAALIAFVKRQTGMQHTEFLRDPKDAKRAIEALKDWLAREGGVCWPKDRDDDGEERKRAVVEAIALRLQEAGGFDPFVPGKSVWPGDVQQYGYARGLPAAFDYYRLEDWDRLANWLGARLRATLAKKRPRDRKAA